ncbi:C2 domain-containing protein [Phascolomyces articulosus]|uniref:C2 domain-containing protein n=1 Tax=Phascolomyces articulosus TaxID=60185 RepID=A0AAD5PB37_9FUNG|nr:C2 domain-containing protein [Phascolomyces articulosus]
MLHNEGSLSLTIVSAQDMPDVEKLGKQDPYVQFSLNLEDKKSFQKTFTHQDAGKNAEWNQTFDMKLIGEPELFIEVMDEEKGVDEVIGFCAIPINQVVQAPGGNYNGLFGLFKVNGKEAGTIHLNMTARGFNSPPGGQQSGHPIQGRSYISEEHLKRVKSMRNKDIAAGVGTAVLGGALAVGAGFLGNKLYKDHEKKKEEEQEQQEQFEQQKQQLEQDRERFEHQKQEAEQQRRRQEEEQKQKAEFERRQEKHHGGGGHHHEGQSGHHHHGGGGSGAREWDPVGTYAMGDRVEYHGRTYVCLQGHTSNPTWMPGTAHSLWQAS